jgi:hypothetical protein
VVGIGFGIGSGIRFGVVNGFGIGLVVGVGIGLSVSQTWASSLASAQLARRWRTPVRLMRFLDDARERGVLRTVGPAYQFRHARLQDRLAMRGPQAALGRTSEETSRVEDGVS